MINRTVKVSRYWVSVRWRSCCIWYNWLHCQFSSRWLIVMYVPSYFGTKAIVRWCNDRQFWTLTFQYPSGPRSWEDTTRPTMEPTVNQFSSWAFVRRQRLRRHGGYRVEFYGDHPPPAEKTLCPEKPLCRGKKPPVLEWMQRLKRIAE